MVRVLLLRVYFNSQPREGGWFQADFITGAHSFISTHSRAKAAGQSPKIIDVNLRISTHSRAKAAGPKI